MSDVRPPIFSVIIPTYNRAKLLPRAIRSVLNQTFTDLELVIVDDGSTDDTQQVMTSFKDPRVKYLRQENKGAADARNFGVAVARGKYVAFLDSDDEAFSTWLAHLVAAFRQHQAAVACCGVIQVHEQQGTALERINLPTNLGPMFEHQYGLFITGGSFALQTEIFNAVGGYAQGLRAGQHNELALRLVPYCLEQSLTIHNISKPLVRRFVHKGPSIRKDPAALLQGAQYILRHHADKLYRSPRRHANSWSIAGVAAMRLGQPDKAKYYFKSAIRVYPWSWRHYVRLFLALVPSLGRKYWLRQKYNKV